MEIKLTPKEKAEQIVDDLHFILSREGILECYQGSILCALRTVEEIINLDDYSVEGREYYQDVKEEIEKLKKNK